MSYIISVRDKWTIVVKEEQRSHRYSVSIEQVINQFIMC